MMRSVAENLTLAKLSTVSSGGVLRRRAERDRVVDLIERLGIRCNGQGASIDTLSGGNQQKVLFGKWLMCQPRVFIVDEPTRGVDVGAKREIQNAIRELADRGLGVLMISSELEELVEGCSRVVVMRDGQAVAELRAGEISQDNIIHAMAEGDAGDEATTDQTGATDVRG